TNGRTCPIDNQELKENELYPDNFAKREINQFTVKCRTVKHKKECPWTGPLQNIEEHLKICEFVEVPCPKGCNQNVERNVLEHHLKKACSKRTITCQNCKTEVQHKNYK
ncbi:TNF receptor-associated factor 6-like, partial [Paramuricea clavata]